MRRPPKRGELALRRVNHVAFTLYARRDHLALYGSNPLEYVDPPGFIGLRLDLLSRRVRWLDEVAGGACGRRRVGPPDPRRGRVALRHGAGPKLSAVATTACFRAAAATG